MNMSVYQPYDMLKTLSVMEIWLKQFDLEASVAVMTLAVFVGYVSRAILICG
jgi:hypothetical protein